MIILRYTEVATTLISHVWAALPSTANAYNKVASDDTWAASLPPAAKERAKPEIHSYARAAMALAAASATAP